MSIEVFAMAAGGQIHRKAYEQDGHPIRIKRVVSLQEFDGHFSYPTNGLVPILDKAGIAFDVAIGKDSNGMDIAMPFPTGQRCIANASINSLTQR